MPTRRIFCMVLLEVFLFEVGFHGIARPWLARHASDSGIKGDLAQGAMVAS